MTLQEYKDELARLSSLRIRQDENNKDADLETEYRRIYNKVYYLENKESLQAKQKEYRSNKLEKMREYQKEYYAENKETKIKQYREDNIEKLQAYRKEYYLKNRDRIIERVKSNNEKNKSNNGEVNK
jgi:hypothetical protein